MADEAIKVLIRGKVQKKNGVDPHNSILMRFSDEHSVVSFRVQGARGREIENDAGGSGLWLIDFLRGSFTVPISLDFMHGVV